MAKITKLHFKDFQLWNLDDIEATTPLDGDLLRYDGTIEKWVNVSGLLGTIAGLACDSSVYVGAAVYWDAGTLKNAIATDVEKSTIVGFVESKTSDSVCSIRPAGLSMLTSLTLTMGTRYFLSDTVAGAIMDAPPTMGTGHVSTPVGFAVTNDRFTINIETRRLR